MTFEGGTFNGAQFASTISNVNSTIAGVVNQSGSDTAAALKRSRNLPRERYRGMIKSVLSTLTAAAASGTAVGKVMDSWGDVLHKILP